MKKFINFLVVLITILFISGCTTTTPDEKVAPTPNNLMVDHNILSWSLQPKVKLYEVEMTLENQTTHHETTTFFDFSDYLTPNILEISFRVKSLKSQTDYTADSNYSNIYIYKVPSIAPVEQEILNQSFINQNVAPNGWVYNYQASCYADGSLKFSSNGNSITSPIFFPETSFKVDITLIGKGAGGDALLTVYGLDSNNQIIDKFEFNETIKNSEYVLSAVLTNPKINKIKFEYTKKATGNFGLMNIHIYHLTEKEIISITPNGLTEAYKIGDKFDYKGSLSILYSDHTSEVINLVDLKDDLKISNFINDRFYKGQLEITYQGFTITSPYVTSYDYPSYLNSVLSTKVTILENVIYFNLNDLDVVIITSEEYDSTLLNALLDGASVEYLIGFHNIASLKAEVFVDLTNIQKNIYHLTPTACLTCSQDALLLDNYNTQILINIANNIDDVLLNEYDYIISSSCAYLAKSSNLIINRPTNLGDLTTLSKIYQQNPYTNIYDLSSYKQIDLAIDQYGTTSKMNLTEISSLPSWDFSNKHQDELYHYNHEEYYTSIKNLVGNSLKEALTNLITSTHTNLVSYNDARNLYVKTDPDFDHPGNIILFYSGQSISGIWENGITWNREHVWAKNLSGGLYKDVEGSNKGPGTDLHQLRPALTSINSSKADKKFGNTTNNIYYEPRDEIKGDVARIIFYMNIRYGMDIEKLGVAESIELLIDWNKQDPVDFYEEYRNEQIQAIQGNFNPFIDNPWLVDIIYN